MDGQERGGFLGLLGRVIGWVEGVFGEKLFQGVVAERPSAMLRPPEIEPNILDIVVPPLNIAIQL